MGFAALYPSYEGTPESSVAASHSVIASAAGHGRLIATIPLPACLIRASAGSIGSIAVAM